MAHCCVNMAQFDPIILLSRDLKLAAETLTPDEVRFIVDGYYAIQADRIRANNQIRALDEAHEPSLVLGWLSENTRRLENNLQQALNAYSRTKRVGRWARSIPGIGPVLSSGLLAHINIEKAPAVSSLWEFAGLNPTAKWERGEKRPWNADLKTLCWKIGESFVKLCNKQDDIYGHIYAQRKQIEIERNEQLMFADQAATKLEANRIRHNTEAYKYYIIGKLPPAHVHARAARYATKIFLAHYHYVAYVDHYGTEPPEPYVFDHLGHVHKIPVPHWPIE